MDLSFKDLKSREVINIVEGKSLGYTTDITLSFPKGVLVGITVPGRNVNWFTKLFVKSQLYISADKIVRIGNDVILVDLKCGETCSPTTTVYKPIRPKPPCPPQGNCLSNNGPIPSSGLFSNIDGGEEDY